MLAQHRIVRRVGNEHRLAGVERALQLRIAIEVDDEIADGRIFVARDEPDFVLLAGEEDRAAIEPEGVAELAGDGLQDVDEVQRRGDFLQDVDDGDEMVALALQLGDARAQPSDFVIPPVRLQRRRRERVAASRQRRLWVASDPSSAARCSLNSSLSKRTTRLRPVSFATYSASSAARTSPSQCVMRGCGHAETPKLAVRWIEPPSKVNVCASICFRTLSANVTAASSTVPGSSSMNSSPPYRPARSISRTSSRRIRANCLSTASPAWWPYVSFTLLNRSRSHMTQRERLVQPLGVLEHLVDALLEVPSVVEPRERVRL